MKRSTLKKVSKIKSSVIQRKIWELCKKIIRAKYGNTCYTCGKSNLEGSSWQTGHMLAKASLGAYLKYDLRLLRPQCFHCNINCGGMGAVFIEKMRRIEGDGYVDEILRDRQVTVNAMDHYTYLLARYQIIWEEQEKT